MKGIIKMAGVCIVSGAACRAGQQLWDDVLCDKVIKFKDDLKKKREEKKELKDKIITIKF